MPAIRPDRVSNRIRLANEQAALVSGFVAKHRTVNAMLARAFVDKSPPYEHGVCPFGAKHNLFARSCKSFPVSAIGVLVATVVAFVEFKAIQIAVFRQPPERLPSNKRIESDASSALYVRCTSAAHAVRYKDSSSPVTQR